MRTERIYTFEATKNSPHVAEFLQHIEIVLVFVFSCLCYNRNVVLSGDSIE